MKYLLFYLVFFLPICIFAQTKDKEETEISFALVSFLEQQFNFGEALEGETLEHTFKFINKGNEPLLISNVLTSCGCTIIEWSRAPIYPGKKGEIIAKLNTKNQLGDQLKTITILSNSTNSIEKINICTKVLPRTSAQLKDVVN